MHTCVYSLYKEIASKAPKEFTAYAQCLDSADLEIQHCKNQQEAFERTFYNA